MNYLVKGGQVFGEEGLYAADVRIVEGVIAEVGQNLAHKGEEIIEAEGCVLSPGFTDLHVHLRQPGYEQKETIETGTTAAAAGGFTTVCSMPNLKPVPDTLQNLEPQLLAIQKDAKIRVLPYGAITVGQQGKCLGDIETLSDFVPGFTDDGRGVQGEATMLRAMEKVAECGSLLAAHAELEELLPKNGTCVQENSWFAKEYGYTGHSSKSEWAEVERDIRLAEDTGCRLHICHTSTKESFALVREAKARGVAVTCEVAPHNLLLSCDDITEDNGRFKMNPPLREKEDVAAAVEALLDGTADAIATDHAPHTAEDKSGGFAKAMNGVVGLETAFPVLYTHLVLPGVISLEKLLDLFTACPRGVLQEKQPWIVPGAKAELTVLALEDKHKVDPETFETKGRATPFEGWELQGWPQFTFYNGNLVWKRK